MTKQRVMSRTAFAGTVMVQLLKAKRLFENMVRDERSGERCRFSTPCVAMRRSMVM